MLIPSNSLFSGDIRRLIPFKSIWRGISLVGADLSGADLSWADLSEADLSGANLSGANLSGADLSWADLSEANLSWADLSGANLPWANLSWADLSGGDLSWVKLAIKSDSPDKTDLVNSYKQEIEAVENEEGSSSLLIFKIYKEFTSYISKREQRQGLSSKFFQPGVTCNYQKLSFIWQVGCILLESVEPQDIMKKLTVLDSRARAVSNVLRPRRIGETKCSLSSHFQGLLKSIRTKSNEHQSSQDNQSTEAERTHDVDAPQVQR
jgi:Pentapeptide repeats (8 copies)